MGESYMLPQPGRRWHFWRVVASPTTHRKPGTLMRARLTVALAGLVLLEPPEPQRIVVTRVFPQPGQIGLFIANADGTDERSLGSPNDIDYDAAWSPDGKSMVFTSERNGSADLYRMN